MLVVVAKWIVMIFGVFFIGCGLLMLLNPKMARRILRKAGSTNLINYGELIIRMIPAAGLIIYADYAKMPLPFTIFGWIMLITSVILLFVPKQYHHAYSLKAADILKPFYFQLISPFSIAIGLAILYNVL